MTDAPPPRAAQRPPSSLQRRLIAAFTDQLLLKVTALFLAIVLWFVVNNKEPQQVMMPVRFQPVLDSTLAMREQPTPIRALVAGSPKELIKLGADALVIRRRITADAPDTLVLDLRPTDVMIPDGVDAVVREVWPSSLALRFESTWSRNVPVRSAIDVVAPAGTGRVFPRFQPDSVLITGPRRRVMQIPSVRTTRTSIVFPDSLPHLVDIDTSLLGPGVRARPSQVKVLLTNVPRV